MPAHRTCGGGDGSPESWVRAEQVEALEDQKRQPLIYLDDLDGVQRYGVRWRAHD